MHGSPEESILIDRQSTPQPKVNASPLLRQSSIGAKQVQISCISEAQALDWRSPTSIHSAFYFLVRTASLPPACRVF